MPCRSLTLDFGAPSDGCWLPTDFDIVHAHDWSISSAMGPARRAGVPVVLTQHDYSHVCATKRLMRGDEVCPGPAPIACLRCASAWHGPVVGPGVALANAIGRRGRTKHVDAFVPVSSVVAVSTRLPGRSPYEVIPNFIPDDLLLDEAAPRPDGPIVFVGDLSRDKGIEVLLEAHKRLGGRPQLVLAGRAVEGVPLDVTDRVELRGLLDHAAVIDLMQTASVVAVPSIVPDCCPTVILEAMAVGPAGRCRSQWWDRRPRGQRSDRAPRGCGRPRGAVGRPLEGCQRPGDCCGDGASGPRAGPVVHCICGGRTDREPVRTSDVRLAAAELTSFPRLSRVR